MNDVESKQIKRVLGIPVINSGDGFRAGLIASGDTALGIVASGRIAVGVFASGAVSIGILSAGALAIGYICAGAVALAAKKAQGQRWADENQSKGTHITTVFFSCFCSARADKKRRSNPRQFTHSHKPLDNRAPLCY